MNKRFAIALPLVFGLVALASTSSHEQVPIVAHCRHDSSEQLSDRQRREAALTLAKAINAAQGTMAQKTRKYHPVWALPNLPPVPSGFELRFYFDTTGYIFALKDTLDSCRYAVFSDESGLLYEKSARSAPVLATE